MPPNHDIPEILAGDELLLATIGVHEADRLAVGHPKSPIKCGRRSAECGIVAAGAGVDRFFVVRGVRGTGGGLDVLSRAGAGIHKSARPELFEGGEIKWAPLALRVRAMRAAAIRPFLPHETKPVQVLQHGRHKLRTGTRRVEVFVA